jgi:hypothetical protein
LLAGIRPTIDVDLSLVVANSRRTPRLRMLPSIIGRIGSSERDIVEHSIPGRAVPEPAWAPHR